MAAGALLISFAPVFVRAVDHALGPAGIAAWRALLGAVLLVAWCAVRREGLAPPRKALLLAVAAGVLLAADFSAWHRSIARVGAGMATILGNTQVFWVALFGVFALGERGGARLAIAVAGGVVGVAMLAGAVGGDAATRADPLGVFLGCLTGILYASFLLVLRRAGRAAGHLSPAAHLAWVSLACGLASFAAAAGTGETLAPPDARTWALVAGLALVAQVAGWILISSGLPHVPVSRAGLLLLLQPTLSTAWGMLFFGERLGPWQVVGAAVTLAAIYLGSTSTGRESKTIP